MEFENVLYTVSDRVARITLNRPEKRNALSVELRREIITALRAAEADDNVTVVLIDGAAPPSAQATISLRPAATTGTARPDG